MSGTAWLAARLAGYLGGWQTLLDSDCVCVCGGGIILCPRQASVHDQWCVSSLPPSPCPEKEQPRRRPAPPAQIELPEQRGVLTSTPSPQWSPLSQPCTQPFSLSSSGGSQQSMKDSARLFLLSPFRKEKSLRLQSLQSWSVGTHWPPADMLSLLFSLPPLWSWLWSRTNAAGWLYAFWFFPKLCGWFLHPLVVSVLCCQINWLPVFVFPVAHVIRRHFPSWK